MFFFIFAFVVHYGDSAVCQFKQIIQPKLVCFHCWYIGRQHLPDLRYVQAVYLKSLSLEMLGKHLAGNIFILICNLILVHTIFLRIAVILMRLPQT